MTVLLILSLLLLAQEHSCPNLAGALARRLKRIAGKDEEGTVKSRHGTLGYLGPTVSYCGICMHNIIVRTDVTSELGVVLAWPCLDGIDVDCESLGLAARRRGLATHGTPGTSTKVVSVG
eukprot:Gb_25060 [translate_table: standard]